MRYMKNKMTMNDESTLNIAVVGGGAAGMMAAIAAAEAGAEVTLFEKNDRMGKKLAITGKGRCNVTNQCDLDAFLEAVQRNPRFLYSAFAKFDCFDVMDFFETRGVPLKTERGNRVFPVSDRAVDIVEALVSAMKSTGVIIRKENVKALLTEENQIAGLRTDKGDQHFDRVIVATGGVSYPGTGSTGDGYRFAKAVGHQIETPFPALVPIECKEAWCSDLMGLSLKNVTFTVKDKLTGKTIFSDFGEMLFTHFGISGPMVLSASSHLNPPEEERFVFSINLKPALSEEELDARILRDFSLFQNKEFKNALVKLLPAKMIPVMVSLSQIPPETPVNSITKKQRADLLHLLQNLPLTFKKFRPLAEAIVTAGGVSIKEIHAATMESKKVKGLYFAGEVLDVDAYTGGFNLQIAFSTGHLAGVSAAKP